MVAAKNSSAQIIHRRWPTPRLASLARGTPAVASFARGTPAVASFARGRPAVASFARGRPAVASVDEGGACSITLLRAGRAGSDRGVAPAVPGHGAIERTGAVDDAAHVEADVIGHPRAVASDFDQRRDGRRVCDHADSA